MSVLNPNISDALLKVEPCPSKYKFSELKMLESPAVAYSSPMAVIALIDMNAFFAQCEQVRLGCTLDDPVVCCQWSSLIAVSYAARKYGIGRMDTLQSAKDKCPELIVGHAAVFQKGEAHWQYLDGPPNQAIHKVSLDPYRRESRKVFKILSRECDLVEKASVDECYLDLGRLVFARLLELFPFLSALEEEDCLPPVPLELPKELKWEGKVIPTDEEEFNMNDEALQVNYAKVQEKKSISVKEGMATNDNFITITDWDDVCSLVGSQFLYKIRQEVHKELNYTTSGGIATTKTVAKLAGGFVKPDFQTVIRPKAINSFLHNFELSDITQMGGQLGERLLSKLMPPNAKHSITYIRKNWSLDQLKEELSDEPAVAERVHELCRGGFLQDIKQRTVVKSMMSRKNFLEREPVKTIKDCYDWIRVFVGDLYGRLIELDDENLNLSLSQRSGGETERIYRPRTVSVQLTTSSWSKMSRQTQFPVIKDLEKIRTSLEATAFRLLCELMDNSKLGDEDIKYRNLRAHDENLDQIGTPILANMGVVITNFVTTSDSSLIDSYSSSDKGKTSDKEDIKRLFDEVNQPKQGYQEKANNVKSEPILHKPKTNFKEDKDYVRKMFEDFQTSVMVEKAIVASPKKPRLSREEPKKSVGQKPINFRNIKSVDLERKSDSVLESKVLSKEDILNCAEDEFLENLIKTRCCNACGVTVEDVFEHKDYHYALQLSTKLNGDTYPANSSRRKPLAQSKLPFGGSKKTDSRKEGQRFINSHPEEIATMGKTLYYLVTTVFGARTLGEEYVDIIHVTRSGKRFPKLLSRLFFTASFVILPYFIKKLSQKIKSQSEESASWVSELFRSYSSLLDTLLNIHVALFYFEGSFYSTSKRVFGMRYAFGHNKDEKKLQGTGNYSVLGGIILAQFMLKILIKVKQYSDKTLNGLQQDFTPENFDQVQSNIYKLEQLERLNMQINENGKISKKVVTDLSDPAHLPYIPRNSRSCMLCLSPMVNPSAANCGHFFCWSCIVGWIREHPECPLCRQTCLEQNLLPLR
ncbi:hypothetical protein JCM33374_g143 [Metschnikowia sp. JCM 33374]|nr:hypothetical protein JCM33374_g143 [Metschnikowia sp. JCM 33374]